MRQEEEGTCKEAHIKKCPSGEPNLRLQSNVRHGGAQLNAGADANGLAQQNSEADRTPRSS